MTQRFRLAEGGLIDRTQPIGFRFNDTPYEGYTGDTLASALLANGVHLVGRSFKYHRPRGVFSAGAEEPNALLQLGEGARSDPNMRATQVELIEGLTAKSQNCWPGVGFDVSAPLDKLSRFLPAGFYYKTFMWPASLWMKYEYVIRHAAGLGKAPRERDPDHYDKTYAHCDVLVVGAGPAGLAAALAAAETGAAMAADRIDFVDEDDAGRVLLALFEHVAHPAGADADEHLDKVGTGDGEERHIGLAGDGAGQQGLAGAGRPDQQQALGDLAAEALEFLRILEEFDDFLEFLLGFVDAGDVLEGDATVLLVQQLGARLAEAHGLAAPRLHLAHEKDPYADEQQEREPRNENAEQRRHALVVGRRADADAALGEAADERRVVGRIGAERSAVSVVAGDLVALDGHVAHLALVDLGEELGKREVGLRAALRRSLEQVEQGDQQEPDDHPQREIATEIVHCLTTSY